MGLVLTSVLQGIGAREVSVTNFFIAVLIMPIAFIVGVSSLVHLITGARLLERSPITSYYLHYNVCRGHAGTATFRILSSFLIVKFVIFMVVAAIVYTVVPWAVYRELVF